jgi:uncharacterized DUF497 family protein
MRLSFRWDSNGTRKKETFNLAKHGVSFVEAQSAILDPLRVIAVDDAHSKREQRLFCVGRSERGIVTVRFTRRGDRLRIIGAEYWRKGKELYEKTNR